jgi:hypothetical protein
VLNDGAPVGSRLNSNGVERGVFNVLELFEASPFTTHEIEIVAPTAADMQALMSLSDAADLAVEDWTKSLSLLCRACSEGGPYGKHDHEGGKSTEWIAVRRVAFAVRESDPLEDVLRTCSAGERCITSRAITLAAHGRGI